VLSRLGTDGSSSAGDLATAERVRPQSVSATLEVLAEHGLITRRPDPDDGRRMLVSLSAAGRALFVGRGVVGEDWLTRALREQFTQAERLTVIEAMVLLDRLSRP
jgi:DNA-binding MarR family transcriptional regulator